MMDEFLKAIHDAVLDSGAKDLARKMGVSHVSLLQRSNPNTDTHRLNVEQLYQLLVHSGDMRPLEVLAEEFGFMLVAKDVPEPVDIAESLLHVSVEMADVTRSVADAMQDKRITPRERNKIRKELADVRASLDELEASVTVR